MTAHLLASLASVASPASVDAAPWLPDDASFVSSADPRSYPTGCAGRWWVGQSVIRVKKLARDPLDINPKSLQVESTS